EVGAEKARASLRRGQRRTPHVDRPPEPPPLRKAALDLDAFAAGRGCLRAGSHRGGCQPRDDSPGDTRAGILLAKSQALDTEPGSPVRAQKKQRDRLIGLVQQRADWIVGYVDEVWWSRFAQPMMHSWAGEGAPLRLVNRDQKKEDPEA